MTDPSQSTSRCPICNRPTVAALRPFCSRRCADVDLGRWFGGQYRTPSLRIENPDDNSEPEASGGA